MTERDEVLKSCPFCGSEPEINETPGGQATNFDPCYRVECPECGAITDCWRTEKATAVAAWNRRPALPSSGEVAKALEEALTPSAETKAAYIGEFTFSLDTGPDEFGDDRVISNVQVPWTTIKEIMKAIRARAALSEPVQKVQEVEGVPTGWKLVPVEPTEEMYQAALDAQSSGKDWRKAFCEFYRAMLSAAPEAPALLAKGER